MLIYDAAAEQELEPSDLRYLTGYIGRNKVVALLVSLKDLHSPTELTDLLTRYIQNLSSLGGKAKEQTLIVALTKGDTLIGMENLPEIIRKSILGEEIVIEEDEDEATVVSGVIEAWLGIQKETMNFVRRARADFKEVIYTTSSALGSDDGDTPESHPAVRPSVLSPLLATWKAQQPLLKQAQRRQVRQKIGRAAKESVGELTDRFIGGMLGLIEGAIWGALIWALAGGFEAYLDKLPLSEGLGSAVKWGTWGLIWGAVVWLLAGVSDVVRGGGAHIRGGARAGAILGLLLNGIIAAVVWGIAISAGAILKEGTTFSADLIWNNAMTGLAAGARLGALLGAVWGLAVRSTDKLEIRAPSGIVWSLLVAAIVSILAHVMAGLDMLATNIIWGGVAALVFAFWVAMRSR